MTSSKIISIYYLANSAEKLQGSIWYTNANQIAQTISQTYNVSLLAAVGVIASLSPRNRWDRNIADADNLIKAYKIDPESAASIKVCTFSSGKNKALKILADDTAGTLTNESLLNILKGPKLREFASCILGDSSEVCIDGHAYSVWLGDRITLNNVPSIGKKLRATIKGDYKIAAEILGLKCSELQAITWCTWRRIHGIKEA
jgi:hypothetical protein